MVPKIWSLKVLSDIAHITSGGTPSRNKPEYWNNGSVAWIRTTEVQNCILNYKDTQEFITELGLKKSSAKLLPAGTILLAMIGQGKTRGQVALLRFEASINQNCSAIILNEGNDPDFYYYFLLSQYEKIRALSNSAGQSNLNGTLVKSIKVPVPSFCEQKNIGKILSTWDKAISTTEGLIDNSKQQKKSLMQQLLTGKKRLLDVTGKSFKDQWEEVKIEEVVVKTQLGTTERTNGNEESSVIPLLKMGNLTWGGFNFAKLETIPNSKVNRSLILKRGDFLFNTRNTPALVGKSAVWKEQFTEVTFDNNINRISFCSKVNTDFLCMYLTHGKGKSLVNALPAGSTSVAAIYWKDLKNIKIPLPGLKEQDKIITVLTNAENEIELLKQQLADLKQEKKALMQQLLTGKLRVKVKEMEVA